MTKLKDLSLYSRVHENKLEIGYLEASDAGDYECYLPNGESSSIALVVDEITSTQDEEQTKSPLLTVTDTHETQLQAIKEQTSRVEIVKEVDEDVEIICGLTEHFDDIKWTKKNGVIILIVV